MMSVLSKLYISNKNELLIARNVCWECGQKYKKKLTKYFKYGNLQKYWKLNKEQIKKEEFTKIGEKLPTQSH